MIKFSCEKVFLQNAIAVTSRAVAQKSSIPALEGLLLEAAYGYLTVSGSKEVTSKDMPEENQKDAATAEADASKKDAKAEQKTVKYIRQERYSGNVSRSFYVGENLEEKDIHAKFENGTLTLTFPKELEKKAVEEKHFVSIEG